MVVEILLGITPYHLLIIAITFFTVIAEWQGDVLYWFINLILSIYLFINRPEDSVIPMQVFSGWIFIVCYQVISLLMNRKAKNLSGD